MKLLCSLVFLALLLGLTACKRLDEVPLPKLGSGEAKQEPKAVVDRVESAARKEQDEFVAAMDKELGELKAKVADLKLELTKASGKAKVAMEQQVMALEEETKSAEQKLADIKAETVEKWKALQTGMNAALHQLKQSVQKAGK